MAKRSQSDRASATGDSFESSLANLEQIVHDLEEGELSLAQSLERYEQGIKHYRHCLTLLDQAKQKVELLTGVDAQGNASTTPFGDQAASLDEQVGARRRRRASSLLPDLDDELEDEEEGNDE